MNGGQIFVTSLKVFEGDRIFDRSEAEVKYSVTFQNLKAGGKNIWPPFINNKQYCLITWSKCWDEPQTSRVYSIQCPGIFDNLASQTKNLCLIYTVYNTHYTMYHTEHSLAMKKKRHKRKFIQSFNILCI